MERWYSCLPTKRKGIFLFALFLPLLVSNQPVHALTESYGQPYHGRLINGIPFPTQFQGYQLRQEDHTYTTPEVIGAVLDAIDAVQKQFPNTCDLYMGDFSRPGGGGSEHHRSHQNGRDVDIGMYAKDNRMLDTLVPMNQENLDAAKTWCLIENLLRSQRVQYIFLDSHVQKLLYDYAVSRGIDSNYLDHLFGGSGWARGSIIHHVPNHVDHMHVRFFTPWSTLAAQIHNMDDQKRTIIEMAQQSYLPKKVFYYAKGSERGLDGLAQSFGVNRRDLCRWNQLHGNEILSPGSCLVFYKRGFELEPVHLAQSLQPDSTPEASPAVQLASYRPARTVVDVDTPSSISLSESASIEREQKQDAPAAQTVRRGDTLEKLAKANKMDVKALSDLNVIKKNAALRPGQKVLLASAGPAAAAVESAGSAQANARSGQKAVDSAKARIPQFTTYTTAKGDTLSKVAKKNGMDLESLCVLNGMAKDTHLRAGQKIKVTQPEAAPQASPAANGTAASSARSSKAASSSKLSTIAKPAPLPVAAAKTPSSKPSLAKADAQPSKSKGTGDLAAKKGSPEPRSGASKAPQNGGKSAEKSPEKTAKVSKAAVRHGK